MVPLKTCCTVAVLALPIVPQSNVHHTPNPTNHTAHSSVPVVTQLETPSIDLLLSAAHLSDSPLQHNQTDDALVSQTPVDFSPTCTTINTITQGSPKVSAPTAMESSILETYVF